MKHSKHIFIFFFFCFFSEIKAQDPNFSQFYFNKLYYNPAFAGTKELDVSVTHRTLHAKYPGGFNTQKLSLDRVAPKGIGWGLMFENDIEGEGFFRTTKFGGAISHDISALSFLNNKQSDKRNKRYNNLQYGGSILLVQRKINLEKLLFSDQLDPVNGKVKTNSSFFDTQNSIDHVIFPDLSLGVIYLSIADENATKFKKLNDFTFGASVHHLQSSLYKGIGYIPVKYVGHIHTNIHFKTMNNHVTETSIAPAMIYQKQENMQTFLLGTNIYLSNIFFGPWFKFLKAPRKENNFDAISFVIGSRISMEKDKKNDKGNYLYFYFSYDWHVWYARNLHPQTIEFNISYSIDKPHKSKCFSRPFDLIF